MLGAGSATTILRAEKLFEGVVESLTSEELLAKVCTIKEVEKSSARGWLTRLIKKRRVEKDGDVYRLAINEAPF